MQPAAVSAAEVGLIVLLEKIHAVGGQQQARVVVARDVLPRIQIPDRELEMFAGPSGQLFEVAEKMPGSPGSSRRFV